ncbi:hypothetical protein [Actinotalea sp. K2]|uniref:hypothetical protein n=1 Tax=Actinotalea sp. K2 TaxID=2939438 RepID=UPI002016AD0D|nr:hypothetical protein [Actinotalea sp. K2]MCL3863194.1 hypothetical protein [Actinotalea sp. K2]
MRALTTTPHQHGPTASCRHSHESPSVGQVPDPHDAHAPGDRVAAGVMGACQT